LTGLSEQEIRAIVAQVLAQIQDKGGCPSPSGQEVPVEVSARHVHLDRRALDILFGKGYELTRKRDLSQPGQFLAEERVKLVTQHGQIANVGILGPLRREVQVELSLTDARQLGIQPPIRQSGDLRNASDVLLIGPEGVVNAKGSAIVAKAHVHMSPNQAADYGVTDGERVAVRLGEDRPVTLEDVIVRVREDYALAVHIDCDEANAAHVTGGQITGRLFRNGAADPRPAPVPVEPKPPKFKTPSVEMPRGSAVPNAGKLITEDIAAALLKKGSPVHIPAGAIVTPLARDLLNRSGLELIWE